MAELVVRRLLVDLEAPIERLWNGGDAFRTAWFNALSMSFPVGEQFFIDSVRRGLKALPDDRRAAFEPEVQAFIGQEATHRRLHDLFNRHLAAQGHENRWAERARLRIAKLEAYNVRQWVGSTAATEHITAIFADWQLRHPEALAGAEPRLTLLWLWHAAEESEHRSTAFDLYRALGGNERWRRRLMVLVTAHFLADVFRQTLRHLRDDGVLWRWSTWRSAHALLFGREGLLRQAWTPWRAYFRADFHPRQASDELSRRWLQDNASAWVPVRGG